MNSSDMTRNSRLTPIRVAAAALLAVLALANAAGLIFFGIIEPADPVGPLLVFTVLALAAAITALAAVPGLIRGRRAAWQVAVTWTAAIAYWGIYKIFAEGEMESLVFLAGEVVLAVLILVPAGRPASVTPRET